MIKKHLDESKISQEAFCYSIGITPQGLGDMYRFKRMKVENLESIAKELKVSPCIFLEKDSDYKQIEHHTFVGETKIEYQSTDLKKLNEKLEHLENELRLKDELMSYGK
jgi:hypothetical protein